MSEYIAKCKECVIIGGATMLFPEYIDMNHEIVRCRDCVYYNDGIENGRRYAEPHCLAIGELAYGALFGITEDDYCSWGERKEGSDD